MENNLFRLDGKNVLITGGSGILGKTFCEGLLQAGANLAIYDVNEDSLNEQVIDLSKKFPDRKIISYLCDVASLKSVKECFNKTIFDFNEIHVLHNNAASKSSDLKEFFKPYEDYSFEIWKEVMDVNINGMFLMSQAVGKHMVEKKIKGSIVQTSSIYGLMAPDQSIYEGSWYMDMAINTPAVYSASKAAVIGLTQFLASYWGSAGIRVNSLVPGGVESGQNDTFKNLYSKRIPMGRMGKAEEVTAALIFLASDASSYITGHHLPVDGGLNCW